MACYRHACKYVFNLLVRKILQTVRKRKCKGDVSNHQLQRQGGYLPEPTVTTQEVIHRANCFRASKPLPYRQKNSILHVLIRPLFIANLLRSTYPVIRIYSDPGKFFLSLIIIPAYSVYGNILRKRAKNSSASAMLKQRGGNKRITFVPLTPVNTFCSNNKR